MATNDQPPITESRIAKDVRRLGVKPGDTLMLHASVSSIGWVVGGPDVVLDAILNVLTARGTLMMFVGWEDHTYHMDEWSVAWQQAYLEECPAFDPKRSRARRKWSILTEYLRTRPGAQRSTHPEASVAAIGRRAPWLTENQPRHYAFGKGSPFAKLCEANGKVLLLGAPLETMTVLHHAETLADLPAKRTVRYRMPVLKDGQREWIEIEDIDSSKGIVDWSGEDYFAIIAREALQQGIGHSGKVGQSTSHLFDADELVTFGIDWMERTFRDDENGR